MAMALHGVLMAVATVWSLAAVLAVWRALRKPAVPSGFEDGGVEPVSVLKPLCGLDEALEDNLRSFFVQTHPRYQLVFGIQGEGDPALPLVRRLKREHPHIPCAIVVHEGGRGLNPKVSNLRAMLDAVAHDVVWISDSNVAVSPGCLERTARELAEPGVGLVCSLVAGVGERSLGATLENLYWIGTAAPGMVVPTEWLGHPSVIGKSVMCRRSVLDAIGGLESLAHVLAEDYFMGRMFAAAGYRVRISATPVYSTCMRISVEAFLRRQVRWGMMRLRLVPVPYLLEPLTMPWLVALAAPLFGVPLWPVWIWGVGLQLLREAALWWLLRGPAGLLRAVCWSGARDVLVLVAWSIAPWLKHVAWRGRRLRLSAGTRLYADAPRLANGLMRVER